MISKTQKKTLSITSLISRDDVNVRLANNYDIPAMLDQIVQVGKITTPIICKKTDEGYIVLQGHRRTRAGQLAVEKPEKVEEIFLRMSEAEMVRDPEKGKRIFDNRTTLTKEVVDNLSKVEVIVHEGLTEEEEMTIVFDHGSMKPISRTETVMGIWRMDRNIVFSVSDIIRVQYFNLARFSGNERKLSTLPTDPKEREKTLKKWFHGTLDNFILTAHRLGDYVKEQFIMTMKAQDKLLQAGEKVEMECSRERITQLRGAKMKEKDVWTWEKGSPEFNKLVEQFKAEDAGTGTKEETKKRLSSKELNEKADNLRCAGIKKALWIAAGETGEHVQGLAADDDRCYRDEMALKVLGEFWDKLPKEYQTFATHVMHDSPAALNAFLQTLVVAKD